MNCRFCILSYCCLWCNKEYIVNSVADRHHCNKKKWNQSVCCTIVCIATPPFKRAYSDSLTRSLIHLFLLFPTVMMNAYTYDVYKIINLFLTALERSQIIACLFAVCYAISSCLIQKWHGVYVFMNLFTFLLFLRSFFFSTSSLIESI